ncbi:MAG: hypothetical protein M1819_003607 [Sarea resinae]|nr:MAG: hypothetical protein M1819_003607 [Sarea resinae]
MSASTDLKHGETAHAVETSRDSVLQDGGLEFTLEYAQNGSKPSYQEATGAPVETDSPLGYNVGWLTTVFLNLGQMIGTGVFSTPGTIFDEVGSVGLALLFWALGAVIAAAALATYLELASYFPNRSGAEVVFLEQAYPRPRYLLPMAFAVQSVILSFSSSNAIVLSEYLFKTGGREPTAWQEKGVAVAGMTLIIIMVISNTRFSMWVSNTIGVLKIITLTFIAITGLVVLGGNTSVADPKANFRNAFEGTTNSGYGITNAIVKVNFAYFGYQNAFNVVNEVKNPVKTLKKTAPASLLVVAILYMFCNIAYFAAVPKEEIKASGQLAASLFFKAVFGSSSSSKALNFLIALSAFGNITSVVIGSSRVIRECGRQGVLPFPRFWASTRPFGTPLGPYLLKWGVTVLMILAPPAGDAFNFIVDLQSYPSAVFNFLTTFGLFIIRRHRARLGLSRPEFHAWNVALVFTLAVNVYLLAMPWYPPATGATGGDVSFWYATYCVTGLGILAVCGIYYWVWIFVLPHFGKYQIRQEVVLLDEGDGANTHRLVKVPNADVASWDATHDARGNSLAVTEPVAHEKWSDA